MSPWFMLCCAAVSYYMAVTSPRYNSTFGILAGAFIGFAAMFAGIGQ
jgi:hypothetical protein